MIPRIFVAEVQLKVSIFFFRLTLSSNIYSLSRAKYNEEEFLTPNGFPRICGEFCGAWSKILANESVCTDGGWTLYSLLRRLLGTRLCMYIVGGKRLRNEHKGPHVNLITAAPASPCTGYGEAADVTKLTKSS